MNYEVVIVGAGIGGLSTAALLAARGVNVCLLERQSRVGGCLANFEHLGYRFEPTCGLYSGWEPGGIFERIFSELPVEPPRIHQLSPAYVVRLPDATDVSVSSDGAAFESELRRSFPECTEATTDFYRELLQPASISELTNRSIGKLLERTSPRFRRFIDIQLQTFLQRSVDACSLDLAALALDPQRGLWEIEGGAEALADSFAQSLKKSGGTLRLDSPVLRLAYGSDGSAIGVDLLSGEQVIATRAIISNLTVWDTYGKLIGLSRTPPAISSQLRKLRSWGAYLLFLAMNSEAASHLPSRHILALTDWQENQQFDPEVAHFALAAASNSGAAENQTAVTVSAFTNAEDWFAFHEDHTAHEAQDQKMLEVIWSRLHAAMPELGDGVEVIETATPQTLYETTRRKFGMIGHTSASFAGPNGESFKTHVPNVFLVGDTVSRGLGIAGVSESARGVANAIAPLSGPGTEYLQRDS
jgi:phytoene dehydrogenase-like protein